MVKNMNDKYIFKTDALEEMKLVVNRHKLVPVLYELENWRRNLYKGYDNNIKYLRNGKIYDQWENIDENFSSDDTTNCKDVYLVEDIINQIDDILYDINNIING